MFIMGGKKKVILERDHRRHPCIVLPALASSKLGAGKKIDDAAVPAAILDLLLHHHHRDCQPQRESVPLLRLLQLKVHL